MIINFMIRPIIAEIERFLIPEESGEGEELGISDDAVMRERKGMSVRERVRERESTDGARQAGRGCCCCSR